MAKSRRDINALNDAELGDYIHALDVLRERSSSNPDDETGYSFQAALHNSFEVGPCEHGNDLFFAWHRAHLHYFEKLLQEADPPRTANVTIPYWDWIHEESAGRFPGAFDTPGLFVDGRNVSGSEPLPPDTLSIVTDERLWGAFGGFPREHTGSDFGKLELGPHNDMHSMYIGGPMGDPATAAEDPIYFSFHCFIDLLWAEWQRRNGSPPPTSPDHDLRGFGSQPKHQVKDFQDTEALDYVYGYSDKLNDAFGVEAPLPPPPPAPPELRVAEPAAPVFEADTARAIRETERLQYRLPVVADGPVSVVRVRVRVPNRSYVLRAYVHPADVPFDRDDRDFGDRYYIGYLAAWQSHAMPPGEEGADHAHHPPYMTARFDATEALAAGPASGDRVLTLDVIPAPSPTGVRVAAPEISDEVEVEDVALEVYG